MTREEALRKAKALLALAEGNGATEGEATNAAIAASRLISRYEMSEEELKEGDDWEEVIVPFGRDRSLWQEIVGSGLSKRFGCAAYVTHDSVVFCGRGAGPFACADAFGFLKREMHRIARSKKGVLGVTAGFMLGMSVTVSNRLLDSLEGEPYEEEMKTEEDARTDMAILVSHHSAQEELLAKTPNLRPKPQKEMDREIKQTVKDGWDVRQGMHAGMEVPLGVEKPLAN